MADTLRDRLAVDYDEQTLFKVHQALARVGLTAQQAIDAVFDMQNQGILFRERADTIQPEETRTDAPATS